MWKAIFQALAKAFSKLKTSGKWVLEKGDKWIWQPCKEVVSDMVDESLEMVGRGCDAAEWCLDKASSLWPFGGGGGGPAIPKKALDLPTGDDAQMAVAEAKGHQKATDILLDDPIAQVRVYLRSTDQQREAVPLTKLSVEQQVWLAAISKDKHQHQLLLDAPDRKIFDALRGIENAIPGVRSYGVEEERPGPLTDRIHLFRTGELERSPAYAH
jgi:hypothetical protein